MDPDADPIKTLNDLSFRVHKMKADLTWRHFSLGNRGTRFFRHVLRMGHLADESG